MRIAPHPAWSLPGNAHPCARSFQFVGRGLSSAMDRGVALRGRFLLDGSDEDPVRGPRQILVDSAGLAGHRRHVSLRNQLAFTTKIKLSPALSSRTWRGKRAPPPPM